MFPNLSKIKMHEFYCSSNDGVHHPKIDYIQFFQFQIPYYHTQNWLSIVGHIYTIFIYYDDFLNAEIIKQPRNYAMIHRSINSWESVVLLRTSVR